MINLLCPYFYVRTYVQDNQYLEQCGFMNNGQTWVRK
jgi:hypothetical protein